MRNNLSWKFVWYSAVCVLLGTGGCSVEANSDQAPNIIFFLVDDQRDGLLSCEGHPIVQTPSVDRLAEKGVRFQNAFVTTSICAASRASILTGLYESSHSFTFGTEPLKEEWIKQSYPFKLKKAGYQTGFVGKFGVRLQNQDSLLPELFDYHYFSPINAPHFVQKGDGSRRHSSQICGDKAIDFLEELEADQPFCLSVSFNAVHAVDDNHSPGLEGHYPYPKVVEGLYPDVQAPLPRLNDPTIFDAHPDFLKTSLNRIRYHWRWDSPEKYQINMIAYYRMISGYDHAIQRILDVLSEKEMDKNTIIIFSADNGYYLGDRGFAGKWSHYEESIRVPLIIYDPRLPSESIGKVVNSMSLNLDIPATIMDYAGLDIPEQYQGGSLVPIVKNSSNGNWRSDFIIEHRMDHEQIPKFVGLRDPRYVYARYYEQDPPYEYLHDLEKDPEQLVNLADDQNYAEIMNTKRARCLEMESRLMKIK